jgi:hypothetical protein
MMGNGSGHVFGSTWTKRVDMKIKNAPSRTRKVIVPKGEPKKLLPVKRPPRKKNKVPDVSASYNKIKQFSGKQYTGMAVGRSHKWYYDKGEWHETKITPDLWSLSYAVTKRRAGKAPVGSGAAVGTGYHWYILAHQQVDKLNADDYSTKMTGLKFKLAHKRAATGKWSATAPAQRKRLIGFLKTMIAQLEQTPVTFEMEYRASSYKVEAMPVPETWYDNKYHEYYISINSEHIGIIRALKNSWKMDFAPDAGLINAIGKEIMSLELL